MRNLNIDLLKKAFKQNKSFKLAKTQIIAMALAATTVVSAGTITASAAEVKFDSITITQDGNIKEQDYTSSYLSDKDARNVRNMMNSIDMEYQAFYNLMANGLFNNYTMDSNACIARLVATSSEIKAKYESQMKNDNFGSSLKNVINKYLESKKAEATMLFANITNISASQIKNFEKDYDYTFATVINGTNNPTVAIYKKGSSYTERIVTFNDNALAKDKALITMPILEVYTQGNRLEANTQYQGIIVNSAHASTINQIIKEAEALYDRMAEALNKGNYTRKSNGTMDDVLVSLNGDLNLISSSLETKYAANKEAMETVRLYMNYRSIKMTVDAYNKNKSKASYADFVNYANTNSPIRSHEQNGYVYYNLGTYSSLYRLKDNGYITTASLSATGSAVNITPSTPSYPNGIVNGVINATVYTGINLYYNDYTFVPVDVNGNQVYPFVYNGTTYLPVRAIAGLCNYNVEWNQATNSVHLTKGSGYNAPQTSYNNTVIKSQLVPTTISGTTTVRVFIDGVELIPRDANGQIVPVINWNGTTYLPVRALANQVGLAVQYDAENQAVFLGQHYTYNQPTTPVMPEYPTTPDVTESREYIYGEKDGVEYKIYFDDDGFYVFDGKNYVTVDITEFSFGKTR